MYIEELITARTKFDGEPMLYEYSGSLDSLSNTGLKVLDWLLKDKASNKTHGYLVTYCNLLSLKKEKLVIFGKDNCLLLDFGIGPVNYTDGELQIALKKQVNLISIVFSTSKFNTTALVWDSFLRKILSDGQDEGMVTEPIFFLLNNTNF